LAAALAAGGEHAVGGVADKEGFVLVEVGERFAVGDGPVGYCGCFSVGKKVACVSVGILRLL